MLAISSNQSKALFRFIRISSISLVHRMGGWAILQDNRMVYQILSDKNN